MKEIVIGELRFVPYITCRELDAAIERLAVEIRRKLGQSNPLFVCIMNGAFMFSAELLKHLDDDYEVAFARYSSYSGTSSTFQLKEVMPLTTPVKDRTVVIIEDLIDTGFTMQNLKEKYLAEGAAKVYIATMLIKPEALVSDVSPDFVGIEIENKFIVGHGLDYNGHGRLLKDIYQLAEPDTNYD